MYLRFALALALASTIGLLADNGKENGKGKGKGKAESETHRQDDPTVWESDFVRIGTLGIQNATGTDPLQEGSIEVTAEGNVEITLEGAMPSSAYTAAFCRFALTSVGCMSLTNGSFTTGPDGKAKAEMQMPMQAANWSGIFILSRSTVPQFATAFTTRNPNPPAGADIELKGRVSSIDLGNNSFRLDGFPIPIFVTNRTTLVRLDSLNQLRSGDRVEVSGVSISGGIEASRVKGED